MAVLAAACGGGPQAANANGPAYTGQFDCEGLENGARAYAGRVDIQPAGLVTLTESSGAVTGGGPHYDAQNSTFTFSGGTPLANAIYNTDNDTLTVVFQPSTEIAHAANGGMQCQ